MILYEASLHTTSGVGAMTPAACRWVLPNFPQPVLQAVSAFVQEPGIPVDCSSVPIYGVVALQPRLRWAPALCPAAQPSVLLITKHEPICHCQLVNWC